MKVAIVHEWFVTYAGSEKVVEQLLQLYPQADLFSVVDFLSPAERDFIQQKSVTTTFIQSLPGANPKFRRYLPLMPIAIEQLDVSGYDLVLSSNHAVAKGVLTHAQQQHLSYVHTPIRYAWDFQHQYLAQSGLDRGLKSLVTRAILHYLRLWDVSTANRVDHFAANSHYVARRIWRTYRRPATVIYPPVAVQRFSPNCPREDFYLAIGRFVPYKRMDLIVAAFAELRRPLIVIGDGDQRDRLQAQAPANITFLGYQPDAVVADYLQRCRAYVFAAEEDFGITPVEAQAAGAPVIAYGRGGVTETVIDRVTGLLFTEQTVASLVAAVQTFERDPSLTFPSDRLRQQAERFSEATFRQAMQSFILNSLNASGDEPLSPPFPSP